MALMERVSTLLRANLNDLMNRAEDPAKMIKQVILDMENQLMQVKTQVAVAVADLHVLERRRAADSEKESTWMRKADLALARGDEALARAAVERAVSSRQLTLAFEEQIADQRVQVENLKSAFAKLESKLAEARAKGEMAVPRRRRTRVGEDNVRPIVEDPLEERFASLEREEEVERILAELKARKGAA